MSTHDFELLTPQELREEQLLKLIAVFVQRCGGETFISKQEYDTVAEAEVFANQLTPDSLRLRLYDLVEDDSDPLINDNSG